MKGTDPSLRDRVVDDLVAELLGGDDRTLALEEYHRFPGRAGAGDDEPTLPPAPRVAKRSSPRCCNAAGSPPFMTAHRVVVVRDAGALTAGDAEASCATSTIRSTPRVLVFVAGGGTMPARAHQEAQGVEGPGARARQREDRQGPDRRARTSGQLLLRRTRRS